MVRIQTQVRIPLAPGGNPLPSRLRGSRNRKDKQGRLIPPNSRTEGSPNLDVGWPTLAQQEWRTTAESRGGVRNLAWRILAQQAPHGPPCSPFYPRSGLASRRNTGRSVVGGRAGIW